MRKTYKLITAAVIAASAVMVMSCGKKSTPAAKQDTATPSNVAETTADSNATPSDTEMEAFEKELKDATILPEPDAKDMGTVKLPELSDISVTVYRPETMPDSDFDKYLERSLQRKAAESTEPAALGDILTIDYTGTIDGQEYPGSSQQNVTETLGNDFIGIGLDQQLVGKKAGETVQASVTYPADWGNEQLNGKTVVFSVKVNSVKKVPALTDDYVKSLNLTGVTTVDQYKAYVKDEYNKWDAFDKETQFRSDALQQIIEKSEFTFSDSMNAYVKSFIYSGYGSWMKANNKTLKDLLSESGQTMKDLKANMDTSIDSYMKNQAVVKALISELGITATDENMQKAVEYMSTMDGTDYTKESFVKQYGDDANEYAMEEGMYAALKDKVKIEYRDPNEPESYSSAAETIQETAVAETAAETVTETVAETADQPTS